MTIIYRGRHLAAHLSFPVFGVELIVAVQLPIAVVHDSTSFALSILKRMLAGKVVPELVRKCEPRGTSVYLVDA